MDKLLKVRWNYHLSQDEIAAYLGYSRSYINMCENNKRPFPDSVLERLQLLNYCWDNNQNTISKTSLNSILEDLSSHSYKFYKERLNECEAILIDLNNQKKSIEKEFEILQNRYRALITIESRLIDKEKYNEQDKHWFQYNCGLVKKEISISEKQLFQLTYKIDCLNNEMMHLKMLIEKT